MKKTALSLLFAGMLAVTGCSQGTPDEKKPSEDTSKKEKTQVTEESSYEPIDPKREKKLLNNKVVYYETPKVKTPAVHKDAEKVIKDLATKKKVKITPNLKDAKYRDFIYSTASDIGSLSKEQQKKIAEFVKYVDEYENQIKNKRIEALMQKLKDGKKFTKKEFAELQSLLPIKGGVKIVDTKPKKDSGTTGGNDADQNNGGTDQGNNDDNNQPGTLTGGSNQSGNDQGGNDAGQNNGGTDQGNNDDNNQPGTLTGGSNQSGNDQGGNDVGQNNGGTDQGNNNDDNDQPGMLIGGNDQDDDQQSGSYDPIKARDYAYKWWDKRNNKKYGYYSKQMGGCYDCWYDCTNFVSQALKEGGIKEKRSNNLYWYYSDEKPAYAWGVANSLYKHMKDRKVKQVRSLFDLEVGDIVNVDFDHDGDIEHSAIVTKVKPSEVYITQHTSDKKNAPLSAWFSAGYDVYGWKMKTANGD